MAPRSLCLTTAFAPVPAFLGGSCPLGCSLSAPATGGFSVFSLQCNMYAAGSEKEKRAGGRLHGGYYSTLVRILQWGVGIAWTEGLVVACAAIPPAPPSDVFGYRGTRCTPGGGCAPCTPLGERRRRRLLTWRIGTRFLAFPPAPPGGTSGSLHPPFGTGAAPPLIVCL